MTRYMSLMCLQEERVWIWPSLVFGHPISQSRVCTGGIFQTEGTYEAMRFNLQMRRMERQGEARRPKAEEIREAKRLNAE